jgi:hypothetical protein
VKVLKSRILRRIFGLKKDEVIVVETSIMKGS